MRRVTFTAYGHANVVGDHQSTIEITCEDFLTPRGTCIVGIRSTMSLNDFDNHIKEMVTSKKTKIVLRLGVNGITEEIVGWGSPGLNYSDSVSMVARTSDYECGRTLMINADKAASDIKRELIALMKIPDKRIECELLFTTE